MKRHFFCIEKGIYDMRFSLVSPAFLGAVFAVSAFGTPGRAAHAAEPSETGTMPKVDAKQTTVFLLPTVGENN